MEIEIHDKNMGMSKWVRININCMCGNSTKSAKHEAHLMLESPVPEHIHGGFQLVMGVSQWMVFVRGNPTKIRMIVRGTPIFGTPHKGMNMGKITRFFF